MAGLVHELGTIGVACVHIPAEDSLVEGRGLQGVDSGDFEVGKSAVPGEAFIYCVGGRWFMDVLITRHARMIAEDVFTVDLTTD